MPEEVGQTYRRVNATTGSVKNLIGNTGSVFPEMPTQASQKQKSRRAMPPAASVPMMGLLLHA